MKSLQKTLVLAAALGGLSLTAQAQSQAGSPANPPSTTTEQEAQRGVPGVDVDINRSGADRGVPGVDASIGADRDQPNVDTRTLGAGTDASRDATAPGTTRVQRADRN